jgi:phenylalanine-4-hydroxylase
MQLPSAPTFGTPRLRGEYGAARADYTVDQYYARYTPDEQRVWAELLARQRALVERYAVPEFLAGVEALGLDERIPRLDRVSERLRRLTRWELVGVPGLIPEREFFAHLAQRRFPVTVWIRRRDEFDYLVEPDLFHDFFGHVPLLCDPTYADFIELYGRAGPRAIEHGGLAMLARLYWYGVEFGLMETPQGLRTYGAGILSSFGETRYAIESPLPLRIRFDLARVLRTDYRIDDFQRNYFVIRSFRELIDSAVQTDFLPLYQQFRDVPAIPVGTIREGDALLQPAPGTSGTVS